MRRPDGLTLTFWYCFTALGVAPALLLSGAAGIPFLHSVWWTVPLACVLGWLALARWERAMDRRIRKMQEPQQTLDLPGVGVVTQFEWGWQTEIELVDERGTAQLMPVHIPAGNDGPTARQAQLLRELRAKYAEIRPLLLEQLAADTPPDRSPAEAVAVDDLRLDLCEDGALEDLEFVFGYNDDSDMQYVVVLKDWAVVDAYGAD